MRVAGRPVRVVVAGVAGGDAGVDGTGAKAGDGDGRDRQTGRGGGRWWGRRLKGEVGQDKVGQSRPDWRSCSMTIPAMPGYSWGGWVKLSA